MNTTDSRSIDIGETTDAKMRINFNTYYNVPVGSLYDTVSFEYTKKYMDAGSFRIDVRNIEREKFSVVPCITDKVQFYYNDCEKCK